jgi:hypothetical protein
MLQEECRHDKPDLLLERVKLCRIAAQPHIQPLKQPHFLLKPSAPLLKAVEGEAGGLPLVPASLELPVKGLDPGAVAVGQPAALGLPLGQVHQLLLELAVPAGGLGLELLDLV